MARTIQEKNQMECNKRARAKYDAENFVRQTVKFKKSEMDAINSYCITNDIPKNTLLRMAIMEYIGNPIKE